MPSPYATAAQFIANYDEVALRQLAGDDGTDGAVSLSNDIIDNALRRASDEVRSFTLRGGMYTDADLDALQTSGDLMLVGVVCDVAAGILYARRMADMPESVKARLAKADQTLRDLRAGGVVFGDSAAERQDAGEPSLSIVSASARAKIGMVSDSPFFPGRRTEAH